MKQHYIAHSAAEQHVALARELGLDVIKTKPCPENNHANHLICYTADDWFALISLAHEARREAILKSVFTDL